ncbi:hypothetical protein [Streptomyces sp. NPDC101132]|uniref:hypothetical protein n=1 Tax=Streptomyces sp. NPDC101132 TaxID=3366110 RepID=UPI0038118176
MTVPAVLGAEWLFLVFWLALALGVFALGGGPVGGGIVVGLFVLLWGGVTARLVHRGHTPRCAAISSLASITRLTEGF